MQGFKKSKSPFSFLENLFYNNITLLPRQGSPNDSLSFKFILTSHSNAYLAFQNLTLHLYQLLTYHTLKSYPSFPHPLFVIHIEASLSLGKIFQIYPLSCSWNLHITLVIVHKHVNNRDLHITLCCWHFTETGKDHLHNFLAIAIIKYNIYKYQTTTVQNRRDNQISWQIYFILSLFKLGYLWLCALNKETNHNSYICLSFHF